MWKWPDWEYVYNESWCNTEGLFTTLEPFTWFEAEQRCISNDEIFKWLLDEEDRKDEEMRLEMEEKLADQEARLTEEAQEHETALLKQLCEDRGDTWLNFADISRWTTDEAALEASAHGYCVSLTPQLL